MVPIPNIVIPNTVGEVLDRLLAEDPGREVLVTRSGSYSYEELDALANRAAHALVALGIGTGDRVAACLPNDTSVVAAFHGAMRVGAIWVGINKSLAPPEKRFLLDDSHASLLLCEEDTAGLVDGVVRVVTDNGWQEATAAAGTARFSGSVDPHAPAGIAYTSGTTGFPKGAVHSQHNLLVPGAAMVASRGYDRMLRKADCFALTILNMQVLTTLLVAQAGGCSIIMDRMDTAGIVEWITKYRPTMWNGPPALLYSLARDDSVSADALSSLHEVLVGGADCPEPVREAFRAKFGQPVICSYGLSEAPTIVSIDGVDGSHVAGASGRPLPHLDVRIVDGEVCIGAVSGGEWAGVYVPTLGYWERDGSPVVDGYLHTGDIGSLDHDGFLHILDRKSLLIIRGGANVYPAEVERVLHELDRVDACAVVGIPDERLGERVAAAVVLAPGASITEAELREHCRANLAAYKVPERWIFVDAFPRNSMGKIVRRELAPLFA